MWRTQTVWCPAEKAACFCFSSSPSLPLQQHSMSHLRPPSVHAWWSKVAHAHGLTHNHTIAIASLLYNHICNLMTWSKFVTHQEADEIKPVFCLTDGTELHKQTHGCNLLQCSLFIPSLYFVLIQFEDAECWKFKATLTHLEIKNKNEWIFPHIKANSAKPMKKGLSCLPHSTSLWSTANLSEFCNSTILNTVCLYFYLCL